MPLSPAENGALHSPGYVLDELLAPGQFVFVEPGGAEVVCSDRDQMLTAVARWGGEQTDYFVRWKRSDGTLHIRRGPLPLGWGIEGP